MKNNLNKTKTESSSNSGEVDGIIAAMKLEQGKSFIRSVTILPQYYVVIAFTDYCLEGVEWFCGNSSSVFRCVVCLQHVSERDRKKFDKLLASTSDKKRILGDIYGNQKNGFLRFVLADAIDVSDFKVKLESLKPVRDT